MATGIQSSKIMNLREYQKKAVEWATKSDGLIIAPAGSGKTWISASIINRSNDRDVSAGARITKCCRDS